MIIPKEDEPILAIGPEILTLCELFGNVMKKALAIYAVKDRLEEAQSTGDAIATIEVVKRYL